MDKDERILDGVGAARAILIRAGIRAPAAGFARPEVARGSLSKDSHGRAGGRRQSTRSAATGAACIAHP
ncbi:hypothetical protein [Luteimonas composti]|uniref:hypothetical protein n=1 Tax=Luteimonas composti TaxID=398257 RepID=UPI0036D7E7D8